MQHRRPRILIVEDDMVLSMVEARMLEELHYEIAGKAFTGEEAVQMAGETNPDAILMDIKLKGNIDGFEAFKRIKEFLNVPVIYISGHSTNEHYDQAQRLGYADFLVKPIRSNDLKIALDNVFKATNNELNSPQVAPDE